MSQVKRPRLFNPGAEARVKRSANDELGTARCPICKHPLVARHGRRGPFYQCGCRRRAA